jgi:predicted nucleic acid-binding Zn ribbon protein
VTRRDEPVPLRDAIAMVGKELGLPSPDLIATLTSRWVDIVGPAIAAHAQVRSVRDGECTIVVDGPAWATQLRYGSSDLVARVNERCGEGAVTSVKVVVAGPRKTR